jgi:hypothetical protein
MSYDRQISGAVILRRDAAVRWGVEKIQEFLAMKGPESVDSLSFGILAEFLNCELLAAIALGEFRKRQNLDQLMALHDVVLLNATPLGELLEVHEGQSGESGYVHGRLGRALTLGPPRSVFMRSLGFFRPYRQ